MQIGINQVALPEVGTPEHCGMETGPSQVAAALTSVTVDRDSERETQTQTETARKIQRFSMRIDFGLEFL